MKTITIILICLFTFGSFPFFGQPGSLDGDFDADGKVTTAVGGGLDAGEFVVPQPDGKILVSGYSNNGTNYDFAVVRYNIDGSLDNSFSMDGKVTAAIGSADDFGIGMALQTDGKIFVSGYYDNSTTNDFALVRFNVDGSRDNTFGTDGKVTWDFQGENDFGRSVAVQPDGKVLVCGWTFHGGADWDIGIVRWNPDGTNDNTFGQGGEVRTDFGDDDYAVSIAIQPDGKIIAGGYSLVGADNDFTLVRYNIDGTLDTTFGFNGGVFTDFGNDDIGYSIALQSDGKILFAGRSYNGTDYDFAIARYNTDGTIDNTFSVDGKVTSDFGGNDRGFSVAIQPDGKIVVSGYTGEMPLRDFAIVRYNSDGTLDNTFDTNGKVTTDFGSDEVGRCVSIDPNGKILVAGHSGVSANSDFAAARYISGLVVGVLDFSAEDQTALIYPNPIQNRVTLEYSLIQEEILSIELYDISGKLVKTFIDQESRHKGEHKEDLNFEESIPAGQYVLVIDNGVRNLSVKVIKK